MTGEIMIPFRIIMRVRERHSGVGESWIVGLNGVGGQSAARRCQRHNPGLLFARRSQTTIAALNDNAFAVLAIAGQFDNAARFGRSRLKPGIGALHCRFGGCFRGARKAHDSSMFNTGMAQSVIGALHRRVWRVFAVLSKSDNTRRFGCRQAQPGIRALHCDARSVLAVRGQFDKAGELFGRISQTRVIALHCMTGANLAVTGKSNDAGKIFAGVFQASVAPLYNNLRSFFAV